jgi:hypothetical protein
MKLEHLQTVIQAACGGTNALAYAQPLLMKPNRLEATGRFQPLLCEG